MSAHALTNEVLPIAVPAPGTILADAYRVDGVLASGRMGVILAATEIAAERRVAIKIMASGVAADPQHVARFRREAKAAACLTSNHVVRVLDYGELESGLPYLVMEHLDGTALVDVMRARGPLPIAEAVDYVVQAIHGVAEAHARGIIHRDLKPANLFVTGEPDAPIVKVLDFGASKLTPESSVDPGDPGGVTVEVDSRADIYGLGATLHELISGNPIFFADTLPRIFALVLWEPAESLCALRDDVPPALEAVIMRCLAKAPEARYASVEALAAALSPFGTTTATLAKAAAFATPSRAPTASPPAVLTSAIVLAAPPARKTRKPPLPRPSRASGSKLVASRLFKPASEWSTPDAIDAPADAKRPKRISLASSAVVLKSTMKMPRVQIAGAVHKKTVRMAAFAFAGAFARGPEPALPLTRSTVLIPAPSPARAASAKTVLVSRYRGGPAGETAGVTAPRTLPAPLMIAIAIAFALVLLGGAVVLARLG